MVRWDVEQFSLQSLAGQPPYPYVDGELRKVARDAYVDWQGSRYSVPWQYAGQEVWVQEIAGEVDIRTGRERIAMRGKAQRKQECADVSAASSGDLSRLGYYDLDAQKIQALAVKKPCQRSASLLLCARKL